MTSSVEFFGLRLVEKTLSLNGVESLSLVIEDLENAGLSTYCPSGASSRGELARLSAAKNPYHLDNWSREREAGKRLYAVPGAGEDPSGVTLGTRKGVYVLLNSTHRSSNDAIPRLLASQVLDGSASWDLESFPSRLTLPVPFFYEWGVLVLGRSRGALLYAGVYDAIWASLFQYHCDATVVRAFLELWSPATNTMFSWQGEFSISLWDVSEVFGLPLSGQFYEEAMPRLTEFADSDDAPLPESFKYLLLAFQRLQRNPAGEHSSFTPSFEEWTEFWFRREEGAERVQDAWSEWGQASGRRGITGRERTSLEDEVFKELGVGSSLADEVHTAAFLSLWLCFYVFPSKGGSIRPGVFKAACLMARRVQFNLAIPVLASLYQGLNTICDQRGHVSEFGCVAWHYIYAWLACYFHTHGEDTSLIGGRSMVAYANPALARSFDERQARRLFWEEPIRTWYHSPATDSEVLMELEETARRTKSYEYFLGIRSSFLTFRKYSTLSVEPYSPHRFARMFGFCQDTPGVLKSDRRVARNLTDLLGLWSASTKLPCGRVHVPHWLGARENPGMTSSFLAWWLGHILPFFKQNWERLIARPSPVSAGSAPSLPSQRLRLQPDKEAEDSDRVNPRRAAPRSVPGARYKVKASRKKSSTRKAARPESDATRPLRLKVIRSSVSAASAPVPPTDQVVLGLPEQTTLPEKRKKATPAQESEDRPAPKKKKRAPRATRPSPASKTVAEERTSEISAVAPSEHPLEAVADLSQLDLPADLAKRMGDPITLQEIADLSFDDDIMILDSAPEVAVTRPPASVPTMDCGISLVPRSVPVAATEASEKVLAPFRDFIWKMWEDFLRERLLPVPSSEDPSMAKDVQFLFAKMKEVGFDTSRVERLVTDYLSTSRDLVVAQDSASGRISAEEQQAEEARVNDAIQRSLKKKGGIASKLESMRSKIDCSRRERNRLREQLEQLEAGLLSSEAEVSAAQEELEIAMQESILLEDELSIACALPVISQTEKDRIASLEQAFSSLQDELKTWKNL